MYFLSVLVPIHVLFNSDLLRRLQQDGWRGWWQAKVLKKLGHSATDPNIPSPGGTAASTSRIDLRRRSSTMVVESYASADRRRRSSLDLPPSKSSGALFQAGNEEAVTAAGQQMPAPTDKPTPEPPPQRGDMESGGLKDSGPPERGPTRGTQRARPLAASRTGTTLLATLRTMFLDSTIQVAKSSPTYVPEDMTTDTFSMSLREEEDEEAAYDEDVG